MKEMEILHDGDADLGVLNGKTIAVIGYGAQGRAQALCMRDSGLSVVIGIRPGKSKDAAEEDGFETLSVTDAAKRADIIHILLPDEMHGPVYDKEIAPVLTAGKTLSFSHGFSIVFGEIKPPKDVDVIMVAPKSPGTEERKRFVEGFGVPGPHRGQAESERQGQGSRPRDREGRRADPRRRSSSAPSSRRPYEDLFGEQNVLCGGMVDLMKYGFETLIEAGYPPEMAYFECIHEAKLIVDPDL